MADRAILLTYRDYCELPDDGRRYEVHDGELSVTPAPNPRHQRLVGALYRALFGHVRSRGLGEVLLSPIDVILSDIAIDRQRKRHLYARYRVPFYWMVDGHAVACEEMTLALSVDGDAPRRQDLH